MILKGIKSVVLNFQGGSSESFSCFCLATTHKHFTDIFQMNLSPDEQDLYTEWLSKVEVAFSLLNVSIYIYHKGNNFGIGQTHQCMAV